MAEESSDQKAVFTSIKDSFFDDPFFKVRIAESFYDDN